MIAEYKIETDLDRKLLLGVLVRDHHLRHEKTARPRGDFKPSFLDRAPTNKEHVDRKLATPSTAPTKLPQTISPLISLTPIKCPQGNRLEDSAYSLRLPQDDRLEESASSLKLPQDDRLLDPCSPIINNKDPQEISCDHLELSEIRLDSSTLEVPRSGPFLLQRSRG